MNPRLPIAEKPRRVRGFSFLENVRRTPRENWLLGVAAGLLYLAAILAVRWLAPLTDEVTHYSQIWLFVQGQWRVLPELTTLPGYHLVVAAILDACGAVSLQDARLASAAFGLCAAAGFHALRARLWPGTQALATAQLLALPILAPLLFIAYTDVLALALLLWATWASVARRHWLAAALLLGMVMVRQHWVLWSGLLALLALRDQDLRSALRDWRTSLAEVAPYLLPVLAFVAFWIGNGSISLSPSQSALHPDLSLHTGNVLLALVVVALLLPLQVAQQLAAAWPLARARPLLLAWPLFVFVAFWFGFGADNPYNSALPGYYLHNRLSQAINGMPWMRAAAALLAALAAVGLATIRLRPRLGHWLLPFAAAFLAASWLVELRYVMVPLVLWLALREHAPRRLEWATLALWLLLATWILRGVLAQRLFL